MTAMAIYEEKNKTAVGTGRAFLSNEIWTVEPISFVRAGSTSSFLRQGEVVAESLITVNPSTGYEGQTGNPMNNTSTFQKEQDEPERNMYSLTMSAVGEFNKTVSDSNMLAGDQFAVAATAFHLKQLGYDVTVWITANESQLLGFCRRNGWNYKKL